jgi:hypothetical protein
MLLASYFLRNTNFESYAVIVNGVSISVQFVASAFYWGTLYGGELQNVPVKFNDFVEPVFVNLAPLVFHFVEFTSDALVIEGIYFWIATLYGAAFLGLNYI